MPWLSKRDLKLILFSVVIGLAAWVILDMPFFKKLFGKEEEAPSRSYLPPPPLPPPPQQVQQQQQAVMSQGPSQKRAVGYFVSTPSAYPSPGQVLESGVHNEWI